MLAIGLVQQGPGFLDLGLRRHRLAQSLGLVCGTNRPLAAKERGYSEYQQRTTKFDWHDCPEGRAIGVAQ
ncbi:MAG: hypothetical protein BroJett014_14240 [Planctomycetota bacterium]|nr:MAG: hypothetical protein BroJett014_14240 [Planctomycetota bacterium]